LTVTDGGGCAEYPVPAQSVEVAVHDAVRGGKPVVGGTTCGATNGNTPDQSYQPYPSVTVAAS
jgi:hypothetical protein